MRKHGSKYFAHRSPYPLPPPPHTHTLGMRSIGQNSTFSDHGHVAYQIKCNHEMLQNGSKYFANRPPSDPRVKRSKFIFFYNMVMLLIKFIDPKLFGNCLRPSTCLFICPSVTLSPKPLDEIQPKLVCELLT